MPERLDSFMLIFGDAFNPEWKLVHKGKPLNEAQHIEVNGYANGWVVPAGEATVMTIEYLPQRYATVGAAVSLLSLVVSISFLIPLVARKIYAKH